jgi:hypothetical protein
MSNNSPFDIDAAHRWFGIEFNNGIFPLLEKTESDGEAVPSGKVENGKLKMES